MSILIKGMAMPKNCFDCELFICSLKDRLEHIEDRKPDCPLVEIPTPHGRLIDGDELRAKYRRMADLEENRKVSPISWAFAFEDTIDVIDDFPTILEAEE